MGEAVLELSDTQPFPGWGFICVQCIHTFPDELKYIDWPPSMPCNALTYDAIKGQAVPISALKRFVDDTEECPRFKEEESGQSQV